MKIAVIFAVTIFAVAGQSCEDKLSQCAVDNGIDLGDTETDQCLMIKASLFCAELVGCQQELISTEDCQSIIVGSLGCADINCFDFSSQPGFPACKTPCGPGTECSITSENQECVTTDQACDDQLDKCFATQTGFNMSAVYEGDQIELCKYVQAHAYCANVVLGDCNTTKQEEFHTQCEEVLSMCPAAQCSSANLPPGATEFVVGPIPCGPETCKFGEEKCVTIPVKQCVQSADYTPPADCGMGCAAGTVCVSGTCQLDPCNGGCDAPCGPGTECSTTSENQECVAATFLCHELVSKCIEAQTGFNKTAIDEGSTVELCKLQQAHVYCYNVIFSDCDSKALAEFHMQCTDYILPECPGLQCTSANLPPSATEVVVGDTPCGPVTCAFGKEMCDTTPIKQCVKSDSYTPPADCGGGCAASTVCIDGICELPSARGLICGSGTEEKDGECVPTAVLICGSGTEEKDGECVPTAVLICGSGTEEKDGECTCEEINPGTSDGRRLVEVVETINHYASFVPGFVMGAMFN